MVTCREHLVETQPSDMDKEKCTPVRESGKYQQIIAAVTINLAAFAYGTMVGWTSPMTPQLQSDNPPVGVEPMSDEGASWLGGSLCVGGLLGTPLFGMMAEKFGRKTAGYLVAMPYGICWLVTIFAQDQSYLFVARFFAGIGGAGAILVVPLYVGEIASNDIRGMLGSLLVFFINIGILLTYVLGTLLSFRVFAICASVIPMVYLGAFIFMPESPTYLVRCERMSEAGRSLLWLRGGEREVVDKELAFLSSMAKESIVSQQKVGFKDLFKTRRTIKGVIIAFGLLGGQQLSGIFAIMSYSATIFKAAGSSLSPDMAAIIVGAIQVFGSNISTAMMERAGRRLLILISCAGMSVCLFTLGFFSYFQNHGYEVTAFSWIPVAALSAYVIVYSLGMGPVPFVVASEVFSPEIAGLANSVSMEFLWILAFLVLKFFPTISALVGIYGCFFIFGGFTALTFVFTWIFVPETKGRSVDSILQELDGNSKLRDRAKYITTEESSKTGSSSAAPTQV
ncbi:facilitated trehalose transporter Tret1-like [Neodiprion virginianus]|uniref:facilitated trehalose transporter Tret1-like n=1 Tax=Neodiprion fabricii TaxID=2872261 RepID=UPI001ED92B33|nr:facilitated trehalose transporter Tret1-like [Neodiprion fabricii]XP_046418829.1 facilitated trehalose transporter Tret1-like [Neodiprion fabricii]XP_046418830.1 facilitated trehalose transporter Tret1-like [Neodiprion fabricii]XP_046418831.1 facilitated trehalose transporter Tret1-like [Neodiprion fabricii]XP_046418832.1 facilitated trehalose transporter Tret1-like [Neodiprion fabricii]XP_046612396.1 facilitated trehalose transporter Tret1-like [Neodiprion virginianus]XP_046612397.1 facil